MKIGFSFKREIPIGHNCILVIYKFYNPFNQIKQIEEDNQHLQHLAGVDTFVIDVFFRHIETLPHENDSEEIDGFESLGRQYFIMDEFHV